MFHTNLVNFHFFTKLGETIVYASLGVSYKKMNFMTRAPLFLWTIRHLH